MSWFLGAALSNALIAAAMSIVVLAISRYWRHRPAVVHAMWLIVLLKFVTPPLVNVPLSLGWSVHDASVTSINNSRLGLPDSFSVRIRADDAWQIAHESISSSKDTAFQELRPDFKAKSGLDFQVVVLGCWLTGSVVWISIAGIRIVRFSRLLRMARPCIDLAVIGARVARRIGLTNTPAIEGIDAHIGPLVWPVGFTPKIVLPADLVSKSTAEQLELVLAHEMAHVKRGDHWVHWFTLLVLAAFWWHPMAWLAVRRLRVTEEQCCDAMVVAASPGCALAYAETLVKTLDLLVARRSPPVPASGIGSGGSLKRRCEMILSDRTTSRVGRFTGLLLLLAAITILPLAAMGRDNDEAEKETAATPRQDAVTPNQDVGNASQEVDEDARLQ
ncbi:MAG: M56 family metallopeptidase, partial [Planctomycetota bacterium]|nr:M56 family metallopeptidase [Planctomycetota bacterium]